MFAARHPFRQEDLRGPWLVQRRFVSEALSAVWKVAPFFVALMIHPGPQSVASTAPSAGIASMHGCMGCPGSWSSQRVDRESDRLLVFVDWLMFDVYHYMEVQGQILAQVLISAQAGVSNFIPLFPVDLHRPQA